MGPNLLLTPGAVPDAHPSKILLAVYFLTAARIAKLSNLGGIRPLFVRDTRLTGFGLKVTPGDVKSFFVEARRPHHRCGGTFRVAIGRYPLETLQKAREEALE